MSQSPARAGGENRSYADGWAALYELMRRGHSFSGRERNCLYLNTGGGRFADVSAVSGFDFEDDGRALGVLDWDLDGALDIVVTSRTAPRVRILRNSTATGTPGGHAWVALRLTGTTANRDAIGARVELALAGDPQRVLVRHVACGDAFLSQSSREVHFGLGAAASIESVTVHWPGGGAEVFAGVEAGARWRLVQGSGSARRLDLAPLTPRAASNPDPVPAPPQPSGRRVVRSAAPLELYGLEYEDGAGDVLAVAPREGRAQLVCLWASWCANCRVELRELARRAGAFETAGVDLVAISVDEPSARAAATEFLDGIGWSSASGFARTESLDLVALQQEVLVDQPLELALPTSLLIDGAGRLSVLYRGAVEVDHVLEDVRAADLAPAQRRDFATPFPGRWVSAVKPPRVLALVERLRQRGFTDIAARYLSGVQVREGGDEARRTLADSHENAGRDLALEGDHSGALVAFQRCLDIDPERSGVHVEMGNSLRATGRVPEALEHFEEAVRIEPLSGEAHYSVGLVHAIAGRMPRAREHFELAVRYLPGDAKSHFNLGVAVANEGELDAGIGHVQRALELDPQYLAASLTLAMILTNAKRPEEALAVLERARAHHPRDAALRQALRKAREAATEIDREE